MQKEREMAEAIAVTVVEKIVDRLLDPICRQFNYLFRYGDNIANLSKKVVKLEDRRDELQQRVDAAQRNSETIKNDVTRWLEQAEGTKKVEAEQILKDSNDKVREGCLNLKSRYLFSKKAVKKALDLDEFLEAGQFEVVAHPKVPLGIVRGIASTSSALVGTGGSISLAASEGFESRLLTLRDIIETLKDDCIRMLRICGMGGVGKTTMAKEVEKVVRNERLFHEIAKAEFTQQPEVARIQGYLAESVGLVLNEGDLSARAIQICEKLNDKNKKILLILDNVWRREDLEQVGIPLDEEKMNCKIFLTSRSEDVCADLTSQKIFRIGFLSDQEARILFQNSVGSASYARMRKIAENIVDECGGLPLAIITIGRALANKSKLTWENVLGHLKKSTLPGEYAAVFNSLEVSYHFLEPEEMKECFLICSSFPEGFDVPIEDLVRYGIGLRLFRNIDSVQEARARAHAHIEKLLHSNLLLVSFIEERVKMHDLVRDFALSTACKDLYMVRYGNVVSRSMKWPKNDTHEHYNLISLQCGQMDELPDGLDCPNLRLLKLVTDNRSPKFPKDFYKGMGGLNVLAFSRMFVPVPLNSVQLLSNLRTLSINDIYKHCDVSSIANLENLEVLSLAGSYVTQFPRENGKFGKLRVLDLTRTRIVDGFPPKILSGLICLEELYVRGSEGFFSSAEEEKSRIAEIKSLSTLFVLDIEIWHGVLPKDFPLGNLERFKISISPRYAQGRGYELLPINYTYQFKNTLKLKVDKSVLVQEGFKTLLTRTDILDLEVKGLEIYLKESEEEDLSNMEILSLESCNEVVYVAKTMELRKKNVLQNLHSLYLYDLRNLEAIYHVEHSKTSFNGIEVVELKESSHSTKVPTELANFGNLRVVDVMRCHKLEYMFSLSIARGLLFLERLKIIDCKMMRAVFSKERRDEDDQGTPIEFPRIKYVTLDCLPKLTSLFADGNTFASDQEVSASEMEPLFSLKIALTSLEDMEITKMNLKMLWSNPYPARCSYKLKKLKLADYDTPISHLIQGFDHLEELYLERCNSLEIAFELEELSSVVGENKAVPLSRLRDLHMSYMGSMTRIWKIGPNGFQGFQNLTSLYLNDCNSLTFCFSRFIAKYLVKLEYVDILHCRNMEQAFSYRDDVEDRCNASAADMVFLPKLDMMWLTDLPSLECIGPLAFDFDIRASRVGTIENTSHRHDDIVSTSEEKGPRYSSTALAKREENLQRQLPVRSLFNPRKLWIRNCGKMLRVISFDLVAGLQKLYKLNVRKCASVIEIFEVDAMNYIDEEHALTIPNLTKLLLGSLPKLTCIWRTGKLCRVLEFPNLKELYISNCQSMRYLLCSSTLTSLVNLERIDVSDCKMMEVIVYEFEAAANGKPDRTTKLVLPSLKTIKLHNIPNLKGIFLGLHDVDFPSLENIEIAGCPEMKIFSTGHSSTPNLETVSVNSSRYPSEWGINTILKHVQDEKTKSKNRDEPEDASTRLTPSSD